MATKTINELTAYSANPADADAVPVWDDDAGTLKKATVSQLKSGIGSNYSVKMPFTIFIDTHDGGVSENRGDWFGSFTNQVSLGTLNNASDITFNNGASRLIIAPTAGTDVNGTLTVTGTSVDPDDGSETPNDTEDITVDALATDSTPPIGGTYNITGAYITTKRFKGAITISTTDLDFSDVDVYAVTMEQANGAASFTLESYSLNLRFNNTNGHINSHLYTVVVTGSKVDVQSVADLTIGAEDVLEIDDFFLSTKNNLAISLDGTKDGFFVQTTYSPDGESYQRDIRAIVWVDLPITIT